MPLTGELGEEKPDRRRGVRETEEHMIACHLCTSPIAQLMFRGKRETLEVETVSTYFCLKCRPVEVVTGTEEVEEEEEEATYADTLSAAVDKLQGLAINDNDDLPPPIGRTRLALLQGRKRKAQEDLLICDVCTRDIASGSTVRRGSNEPVEFGIEVVCSRCHSRYQRCSDCGGSGGPRVGVGKWRCKELFPNGRKTCILSHLRLGPVDVMDFDIWAVRDVPPSQIDELVIMARDLYAYNIIAGLAVPEMLEPVTGLAKTFDEVERMSIDSWTMVEPLIRKDIEAATSIRRYLALRWSAPPPRKKSRAASKTTPDHEQLNPSQVIRPGKKLSGFVISEMDFSLGSLFLCITTPWSTGDTFSATTILMQALLLRIESDVLKNNANRMTHSLNPLPVLNESWIIMFFKKSSRLYKDLINRRGFLPVEEYMAKYGVDASHFCPQRPIFLPREFLKGWHVLAKKVDPSDDWAASSSSENRSRRLKT